VAPARQPAEVDPEASIGEAKGEAIVSQTLQVEPRGYAHGTEDIDSALLQDAGPDARQHVVA
jgi:hypothetical protein